MQYSAHVILLLLPVFAVGQDLPKEARRLKIFAGKGAGLKNYGRNPMLLRYLSIIQFHGMLQALFY